MNIDWIGALAEEYNHLAVVYRKLQRYDDAPRKHTRELDLKERLLSIDPTHAYWRRRLAWAHSFIGDLEVIGGDLESALDHFDAALATTDSLIEVDPTNESLLGNRVSFQVDRGRVLSLLGRHAESLRNLQSAATNAEARVRGDTTDTGRRWSYGRVRAQRALALLRAGDPGASLFEAEAARDLVEGSGPYEWARNGLVQGYALEALGRTDEATVVRKDALARLQSLSETGGGQLRHTLAEALLVLDRVQEAEQELGVLRQQGYREPSLWALAASKGIEP
jgi:tetratricopeptide (TPR) repeat protein